MIMDPELYRAAMEGNLEELARYNPIYLETQITPNGNTVLHVACQFGQLQFAKQIFTKYDLVQLQNKLRQINNKRETPLHLATINGSRVIIETILEMEMERGVKKEILRAVNKDGDTVLHMAVRLLSNEDVLTLLIRADPDFKYLPNNAGETLLNLATEREDVRKVSLLLENCTSLDYTGLSGTTVMHTAASNTYTSGCLSKLLEYNKALIYVTDALGWTPLHYAVCKGKLQFVCNLLQIDKSIAYVKAENDEQQTAFHIASGKGLVDIMRIILVHCPDIWDMVNVKGKNVLHIAAGNAEEDSIRFILKQPWSKHLVNEKDDKGNTPIHLLQANNMIFILLMMPKVASSWVDHDVVNDKFLSVRDVASKKKKKKSNYKKFPYMIGMNIIRSESEEKSLLDRQYSESEREFLEARKKKLENVKKMADTHLIVAALVATVTFAAGFTLPGGYNASDGPREGTALLIRKAAFKAFMVTNTIAMVSSVSAIFLYFTSLLYDNEYDIYSRYKSAMFLVFVGLGAMVVAFMTGAYAVLENDSGIAIATLAICCILFLIYILELKSISFFRHMKQLYVRIIYGRELLTEYEAVMEIRKRRLRFLLP